MPDEIRKTHPHVGIARAVDCGVRQSAGPREEIFRLVALEVEDVGAAGSGEAQPLGLAPGDDRPNAAGGGGRRPEQRQRSGTIDQEPPFREAQAIPAMEHGRERVEKRGDFVGKVWRRTIRSTPRRRPARRNSAKAPRCGRHVPRRRDWRDHRGSRSTATRPAHTGHDLLSHAKPGHPSPSSTTSPQAS
jgi:hypothetical protein